MLKVTDVHFGFLTVLLLLTLVLLVDMLAEWSSYRFRRADDPNFGIPFTIVMVSLAMSVLVRIAISSRCC